MENKFNKFSAFVKKNGFYLALAACVVAVGIVSIIAAGNPGTEPDPMDVQKQQSPRLEDEINALKSPSPSPFATPTAMATATVSPSPTMSPSPSPSPSKTRSNASTLSKLQMPLDGEVIKEFSDEVLVYNSTLNMWMTHNGIDIKANSESVTAALAGEVVSIEADENRGNVVTIKHSSRQTTIYAGLSETTVAEGAKVSAGQEIGKVGTPAFEANDGAHLHFEHVLDGKQADPVKSIKQN